MRSVGGFKHDTEYKQFVKEQVQPLLETKPATTLNPFAKNASAWA